MKKIIALLLVCFLLISTIGCTSSSPDSQSSNTSNDLYTSNYQPKVLTESEKEDIAQKQALKMVLEYMDLRSSTYGKYDIEATRYKIGAITHSGKKYTVNGTLYLYDKYGSLKDMATFTGTVDIEDNGSYKAYYPTINIK